MQLFSFVSFQDNKLIHKNLLKVTNEIFSPFKFRCSPFKYHYERMDFYRILCVSVHCSYDFVVVQSVLPLVVSTSSRQLLSVFDTTLVISDSFLAFWYDPTSFHKILPQNLNYHLLQGVLVPFSCKEFSQVFTDCYLGAMLIDTRLVIYRSLQRWSQEILFLRKFIMSLY